MQARPATATESDPRRSAPWCRSNSIGTGHPGGPFRTYSGRPPTTKRCRAGRPYPTRPPAAGEPNRRPGSRSPRTWVAGSSQRHVRRSRGSGPFAPARPGGTARTCVTPTNTVIVTPGSGTPPPP